MGCGACGEEDSVEERFAELVVQAHLPLREKLQSRLESRHQTHNVLEDVTTDVKDWSSGLGRGRADKTMNGLHGSLLVESQIGSERGRYKCGHGPKTASN